LKPGLAFLATHWHALTEGRLHQDGQNIFSLTYEDRDLSHLEPEMKSIIHSSEQGDTVNRVFAILKEGYLIPRTDVEHQNSN